MYVMRRHDEVAVERTRGCEGALPESGWMDPRRPLSDSHCSHAVSDRRDARETLLVPERMADGTVVFVPWHQSAVALEGRKRSLVVRAQHRNHAGKQRWNVVLRDRFGFGYARHWRRVTKTAFAMAGMS